MATIILRGDRVKLSDRAFTANVGWRKHRDRMGTVVSTGKTGIGVCWDGNSPRSVSVYHPDYIDAVELARS